jgi:hypothetical protein
MFHRRLIVFKRRVKDLREKEILLRMLDRRERPIVVNFGSRCIGGSARRWISSRAESVAISGPSTPTGVR